MPPKKKRSRKKRVEVVADIQGTPELDKEELKIKLDNAEKRIRRLTKENETLQLQKRGADGALDDQKKEQVDICEHFLRELQKKEREANAAIETIRGLEAARDQVDRELTQQLEAERLARADSEAELTTRMGVLEARLQELDDFAKIKASVEAEVAYLRDKVVQMERNHKLDLEAQARQYEMDKEKLRSDMVKKLKKTRDGLFKLADDHLSIKTQQTIKENERLTRELELYERESREMLQTNQRLTTDTSALRRSEQVLQESLEDQIRKSRSQQQTIKTLVQKVKDLEAALADAQGLATDDRNEKIAVLSATVDKQYEIVVDLKRQLDDSLQAKLQAEASLRAVARVEADQQEQVRSSRAFLVQCIGEAMHAVETATPGGTAELGLLASDDRQAVVDFLVRKLQLLERQELPDLPPIPKPPPKSQQQTPRKSAARPNRHSPVAQLAVSGAGYA